MCHAAYLLLSMLTCLEVKAWHLAEPSCLIADDEATIPAKFNVNKTTWLVSTAQTQQMSGQHMVSSIQQQQDMGM